MWEGGEYVGTKARVEREFLLRFLRCRNQNQYKVVISLSMLRINESNLKSRLNRVTL